MSHLKVPYAGSKILLNYLTGFTAGTGTRIKLFKNNITPAGTDVLATYTEADFTGYADVVTGAWVAATLDGSNRGIANAPDAVFTQTAITVTNNIYGYYVTDNPATEVLWAERFDSAPFAMSAVGSKITVTPTLTFVSEF
jgi:hypothetical protein